MTDGIKHSTGRGGAGNIGHDTTDYVDGSIVREGIYGESDNPEYSSGRGGAGNIVDSPRMRPADQRVGAVSADVIPETATRPESPAYDNFHTGRGGGGNIHKEKYGGHSTAREQAEAEENKKEGLADKVKALFGKDK